MQKINKVCSKLFCQLGVCPVACKVPLSIHKCKIVNFGFKKVSGVIMGRLDRRFKGRMFS